MRSPAVRRRFAVVAVLATLLAGLAVAPAAAAASESDGAGTLRRAFGVLRDVDGVDRQTDAAVELECEPRIASDTDVVDGAVHCEWRSEAEVRSWQLWNAQIRPERGARALVAELGADVASYTDAEVEVPGKYVYVVLGLDGEGEVIARSRVEVVKLRHREADIARIGLRCKAHRTDVEDEIAVGCNWSDVRSDTAVGYVVSKAVDGGEPAVIARTGLDVTDVRDDDVEKGRRYAYVVVAVDGDGEVVGRSRIETVGVKGRDGERDRPVDAVRDHDRDGRHDRGDRKAPEAEPAADDTADDDTAAIDTATDDRAADTAVVLADAHPTDDRRGDGTRRRTRG
ncbi:MAG: hypothetical protein AAF548_15570 [Actinomycetota bacterium]